MRNKILVEREKTHGEFWSLALLSQSLKASVQAEPGWRRLSFSQREALEMLLVKVARIVNGDGSNRDSWDDAVGYLQLAIESLDEAEEMAEELAEDLEPAAGVASGIDAAVARGLGLVQPASGYSPCTGIEAGGGVNLGDEGDEVEESAENRPGKGPRRL